MRPEQQTTSHHTVGSYRAYAEAARAVDSLADQGFPVEGLTIVARDLRLVEQVTGRMGYGRAGLEGAVAGGLVGAVLGFLFGLLSWIDPLISGLALAVYGFLIGAVLGFVLGLLSQTLAGSSRKFSSTGSISAGSYELIADDPDDARRATEMLGSRQFQAV